MLEISSRKIEPENIGEKFSKKIPKTKNATFQPGIMGIMVLERNGSGNLS